MHKFIPVLHSVIFLTTSFYAPRNKGQSDSVTPLKVITADINTTAKNPTELADDIYSELRFENINPLNAEVFRHAYVGFTNLKKSGKLPADADLLTVCDFSLSSVEKRLWVIDMIEKKILFNSLVAHGKNTGDEFARKFSNTESSFQSSLGFYITEGAYMGSNGYSLKLSGMDEGFNDAAMQRAIVMHGADYVSEDFIRSQRRIGRSWGCPAVPRELAEPIINTIKGQSCLFIYYPDQDYLSASRWLKENSTF